MPIGLLVVDAFFALRRKRQSFSPSFTLALHFHPAIRVTAQPMATEIGVVGAISVPKRTGWLESNTPHENKEPRG
jgi:hypothetical protein